MKSDKQSSIDALYKNIARIYDFTYGPILERGRKKAFDVLGLEGGMRVLEVGIGTGLSLPLYPKSVDLVGIDVSEEMLEEAKAKVGELAMGKVSLLNMSAEKIEFPDNHFDRVVAPSVLSVVSDPQKVLSEMVRVCKPDGWISIVGHFTGETKLTQFIDRVFHPLSSTFFGFRMNTPRDLVQKDSRVEILLRNPNFILNFNDVYLLRKR